MSRGDEFDEEKSEHGAEIMRFENSDAIRKTEVCLNRIIRKY